MGRRKTDTEVLNDISTIVERQSGKFSIEKYDGAKTVVNLTCNKGHTWNATYATLVNNHTWCKECYQESRKIRIEDLQQHAILLGGRLLSTSVDNAKQKLLWECAEGHRWEAHADNVKNNGRWCEICRRGPRRTIRDMQHVAEERGGECTSNEFISMHHSLGWKCKQGHEWTATPNSVLRGRWCPHCAGRHNLSLDVANEIAKERGGECLSTEYVNNLTDMLWRCSEGHVWKARLSHIKDSKSWCPDCAKASSKGEDIVRSYLEQLFNCDFKTVRPAWLVNPETGYRLELDGYNEKLRVAFEHQGRQHYEETEYHHNDTYTFEDQLNRDALKRKICKQRGIVLIEVPQLGRLVSFSNLPSIVRNALEQADRVLPERFGSLRVDDTGKIVKI